jgi:arsenate reductase
LKKYAENKFEVYSAGFKPQPIHPYAIEVMKEIGFDMSDHRSKALSQYLGRIHFGIVITVCSKAEELCPTIPGIKTRLYWPFEDPAKFKGTEEEKLEKFREVRNQIDKRIRSFLEKRGINSSK